MDSRERLWATAIIWGALMVVLITFLLVGRLGNAPGVDGAVIFFVMAALTIAGSFATDKVWRRREEVSEQEAMKAKRSNRERIERLVETMDEDESVELETLLMAREDDELRYDR